MQSPDVPACVLSSREKRYTFFSIPKIDSEKKMKVTVLVDFSEEVSNEVQEHVL